MNATDLHLSERTIDAGGYERRTFLAGGDAYYLGQRWASVSEGADGWTVLLGWREGAGWSGGIECVVSHDCPARPYRTEAGALRRIRAHLAARA
jgi:hypothetical protein